MKKIRWIIQRNLLSENDLNQLQKACESLGYDYYSVLVIPFSKNLPDFPISKNYENIYYGSTTFINNIKEQLNPMGLFLDNNIFSIKNYNKHWGRYMLNNDGEIITINDFFSKDWEDDKLLFIRPDNDNKSFDGQVTKYKIACTFLKSHLTYDNNIKEDTLITVNEPYRIRKEWRNIIVDNKIVTSSMYSKDFKLYKSAIDIPKSMLDFVNDRINEYKPSDCFAIDIAEVYDDGNPNYYIIECGCVNSVGFYLCDINKFVKAISNYVEKKYKKLDIN